MDSLKQLTNKELYAYQDAIEVELSRRQQDDLRKILDKNSEKYIYGKAYHDKEHEILYLPLSAKSKDQFSLECLVVNKSKFLTCHDTLGGSMFRDSIYTGHLDWNNFYMDTIHISKLEQCELITCEAFWKEVYTLMIALHRLTEIGTFNTWEKITSNI